MHLDMTLEVVIGGQAVDELQYQLPELLATAVCCELRLTCTCTCTMYTEAEWKERVKGRAEHRSVHTELNCFGQDSTPAGWIST